MTDVHDKVARSYNMSQIRSKNTKPELVVRKFLFTHGFRYRIHVNYLPGKPDIVLPKFKTVIFIHGCFWHGHEGCKYFVIPKTRTEWWQNKIKNNQLKDGENSQRLTENGWWIITIFECSLKKDKRLQTLNSLLINLNTFYEFY